MTTPLISVIIPTRDRPDTLEVCLRALRRELSTRIEIVVQDNFSGPETAEVVKAAQVLDGRIRYSRAPHPTSQRQSFEFALAAGRGDYMTIIGDDDGFSVGSLDWLAERLEGSPVDAVRWNLLHYVWPSLSIDGEGFMDLYASMCTGGSRIEPASRLAEKVIKARTLGSWENLLVYHGMISRRVYDRMRAKTDGVFFAYPMPDVYAHNLIPFFCNSYLQIDHIVSIYGVSGHSAGASWTKTTATEGDGSAAGKRWMADSNADEVAAQVPWQPNIRTLRYHDYAVFKLAQKRGLLGDYKLDDQAWIKAIIAEIQINPAQIAPWLTAVEKAPYDAGVFTKVRAALPSSRGESAVQSNKKPPDPRVPSLRIKAVSNTLLDNIEGAGLALAQMTGQTPDRFTAKPIARQNPVRWAVQVAVTGVRHNAPFVSSRILNSRLMPKGVWRYLKSAVLRETIETQRLHKLIVEKTQGHRPNLHTEPRRVGKE